MAKMKTFEELFFEKRFGRSKESDPLYFEEWRRRLIGVNRTNYKSQLKGIADDKTLKILRKMF